MRTRLPDKTAHLSYYHILENISFTGSLWMLEGKETEQIVSPFVMLMLISCLLFLQKNSSVKYELAKNAREGKGFTRKWS